MKHSMRLNEAPFNSIKNGTKTIEMRLYDEKRRTIKTNDTIEFINRETSEVINTQVTNLYLFKNFNELYKNFDKSKLGYEINEIANPEDMNKYYSKEEQQKYGVVGIEIKKI